MKISVVIPTFNRENTILKTINSIENQSIKVDEIIVIDDGSTDDTKNILRNKNIKYVYQENKGVSAARNKGIRKATNNWIAFCDSDDSWVDTKIEEQILFCEKNMDVKICYTDEIWKINEKIIKKKSYQEKEKINSFVNHIKYCKIGCSTVLINKFIFEQVGFFDESFNACEDYDLWLRILLRYEIHLLDKELVFKMSGQKNQLSYNTRLIDTYRIDALVKHIDTKYKHEIKEELDKKLKILLKGAIKHKNNYIIDKYEKIYNDLINYQI